MEIANTHEIQSKLVAGELHLAMTEGFIESEELEAHVFAHDELIAVAPPRHPLLGKRRVTVRDLCAQPLIFREARIRNPGGCGTGTGEEGSVGAADPFAGERGGDQGGGSRRVGIGGHVAIGRGGGIGVGETGAA